MKEIQDLGFKGYFGDQADISCFHREIDGLGFGMAEGEIRSGEWGEG